MTHCVRWGIFDAVARKNLGVKISDLGIKMNHASPNGSIDKRFPLLPDYFGACSVTLRWFSCGEGAVVLGRSKQYAVEQW